jgi:hypothetical protein
LWWRNRDRPGLRCKLGERRLRQRALHRRRGHGSRSRTLGRHRCNSRGRGRSRRRGWRCQRWRRRSCSWTEGRGCRRILRLKRLGRRRILRLESLGARRSRILRCESRWFRGWDRRRHMRGVDVCDEGDRLFRNRQHQRRRRSRGHRRERACPRTGLRSNRSRRRRRGLDYRLGVDGWLGGLYGRRLRELLGRWLCLLAQPAEQAFLFSSRRRSLLVVVGTKHGGRLSQGSDAPMRRLWKF